MECLILTVSSDIIFEQQVCSTQIVYTNALSLGINTCKKINTPNLVSGTSRKKQWLVRMTTVRLTLLLLTLLNFVRCCNKVERKYIQQQQPN